MPAPIRSRVAVPPTYIRRSVSLLPSTLYKPSSKILSSLRTRIELGVSTLILTPYRSPAIVVRKTRYIIEAVPDDLILVIYTNYIATINLATSLLSASLDRLNLRLVRIS
ncbi:uncharacterized protein N7482_003282 [Penicillium canariense]|uniref:Uncharacterized protein n=1 Tax=Penicillium canariense TaxID=189055 RepID=A0A9W9I6E4_9EURO|nr:uncharacterized protein N7482_003282 [Penicillium canariense]KAJ5167688.1 hypothetical protein N7482_003282 [Penicillium canariense]